MKESTSAKMERGKGVIKLRYCGMFQSKLFLQYFTTLIAVIAIFVVVMYILNVPFIEHKVFDLEKSSSKTILDNVYEIVKSFDHNLESYRESVLAARKEELKSIVAVVESYIKNVGEDVEKGVLTRKEAEKRILGRLRKFSYRNKDYVFVADYSSRLLSHPNPDLNGKDVSALLDEDGKPVLPPMVEIARAYGDGYYSYKWKRFRTDEHSVEKLTYARNFPEWKWVIATGLYVDDVDKEVEKRKHAAIEELRRLFRSIKVAKTGYITIWDSNYNLIIHPNANIEGKNVRDLSDPVTGKPIFAELTAVADTPNGLYYKWDKPSEPGNYVYDKVSWVRYYKPFGWYINTTIYVEELKRESVLLRDRIFMAGALGLLILILPGYVFIKKLVSPIRELSETALRVKGGDLEAKTDIKLDNELGILADAFNGMVERLRDNIHSLDSKVNERTEELQEAYNKLKDLDEMKSSFLSNVSHELRTPLTSVLGFAEIIKESFEDIVLPHVNVESIKVERAISRISENAGIIISEGERLTTLINDVLDITKMEAGKMVWKCEPINIKDLLNHAARATSSLFRGKDPVRLIIETEENLPGTVGDYDRIIQVMINLISNAVKFTPEGSITLKAGAEVGFLFISVIDTGIGIPSGERDKVFEKFKQLGNTLTDKPKGTGLGLPICKEIVEHHGGRIWVESAQGKGSTFCFSLPIAGTNVNNPVESDSNV
ncbi:MAG: cache domain-containing protein [Nitrospirae bacterium]|nr:cache domain-containing protein [Nitrospirota bacterium]